MVLVEVERITGEQLECQMEEEDAAGRRGDLTSSKHLHHWAYKRVYI